VTFVIEERRGAVAIITLNRPERLNAISGATLADLHAALERANHDDAVRAIVLTGAGRAFCAGDDLKEFAAQAATPASAREHVVAIQRITRDLMLNAKPVVGAVHGYAVGGGFEWLLNCDLVVAADDLVAFFPEMAIGQFVTGGVTWLLPLAVGHQRAMELLVLGDRQGADDLAALGLVNRVVPRAGMLEAAVALATEVAARNAWSVSRLKRVLTADLRDILERALALETEATVEAFLRPEAAAGAARFSGAGRDGSV
jgi:enoyl-CoA hydratase/carnithine racemase